MSHHSSKTDNDNGATEAAQEAASRLAEQAAQSLVNNATSAAREKRNMAADYVASLDAATRAAVRSLNADGCTQTAAKLQKVASMLGDTSGSMASYDVRSLVDNATDLARRNPGITFGLAALAGYAVVKLANQDDLGPRR